MTYLILPLMVLIYLISFLGISSYQKSSRRPFAEYETVKYVVLSAGSDYQSLEAKKKVLSNLPSEVTAIIYATSESEMTTFIKDTESLALKNIEYLLMSKNGEAFWPRDSWPYPVRVGIKWNLVDTPYYENFEPDDVVAGFFKRPIVRHKYFFEHGNLTTNRAGECFVVKDNWSAQIPDEAFTEFYGCKSVTRLPFVAGIGHVDEVLKFVADNVVLTSRPDFVELLVARGFEVKLLPEAALPEALVKRGVFPQRSYVNSLLVNKTVFVPTFGLPTDLEAVAVYESLGLKVIPVNSAYMADYGGGALHCFSATYPEFR